MSLFSQRTGGCEGGEHLQLTHSYALSSLMTTAAPYVYMTTACTLASLHGLVTKLGSKAENDRLFVYILHSEPRATSRR
jgi:hypothetical protein